MQIRSYTIFFTLLTAIFLFFSCGLKHNSLLPDRQPGDAEDVLNLLKDRNKPRTLKGLGKIKIKNKNNTQVARIAWIVSNPEKIFIQALNPFGQPSETFACDGTYLYILSHTTPHQFFKKRSNDPSLKRIITIPIKSSDVISFLSGGIPLYKHKRTGLEKNKDKNGYVLTLKKRVPGIIEKIYIAEDKKTVHKVEIFSTLNTLLYCIELSNLHHQNGYVIPMRLTISTNDDVTLQLDIDRYWADVDVCPSTFVLTEP